MGSLVTDPRLADSETARASYLLFYACSCVLLHLLTPVDRGTFAGVAARLPEGLRLFASQGLAHASYLRGDYGLCTGLAENALLKKRGSYPISEIFLHLVAAMGRVSQRNVEAARAHFMAAWDIARPDDLATTEFSIAMLACRGWSNDEIAAHMELSRGTVKSHLSNTYAKLGVSSRGELKKYMLRWGDGLCREPLGQNSHGIVVPPAKKSLEKVA